MIKISVEIKKEVIVELPFEKYEDICEESMSLEQSDALIYDAIWEKYKISPDSIRVI